MGKDGKEETQVDHLDLPPDLSNGMVPTIIEICGGMPRKQRFPCWSLHSSLGS